MILYTHTHTTNIFRVSGSSHIFMLLLGPFGVESDGNRIDPFMNSHAHRPQKAQLHSFIHSFHGAFNLIWLGYYIHCSFQAYGQNMRSEWRFSLQIKKECKNGHKRIVANNLHPRVDIFIFNPSINECDTCMWNCQAYYPMFVKYKKLKLISHTTVVLP